MNAARVSDFASKLLTCRVRETQPDEKRRLPTWKDGNFQYNWIGILVIGVPPVIASIGFLLGVPFYAHTFWLLILFAIRAGMIGVTIGYHRLFAHRSYSAGPFLMKWTAFWGAGAFQGSIKWWGRLHRIHHKYVDTDKDPYDARRGFFFSHCGWFLMRMDYSLLGDVDMSDLDSHPVVKYQRDNFAYLAVASGILLPWLTSGLLFNDWLGGFFYVAFFKVFAVHQFTFCINSLCHTNWFYATQNYSADTTPHDSVIFAIPTFGEGYHNFHHAFAQDYRNGYEWYHFDPTKWYIFVCYKLGLCWDLYRTPDHIIRRAFKDTHTKLLQREAEKAAKELRDKYPTITDVMTEEEMRELVKTHGRRLLIVEDYVLDLDKPIALESSATHGANLIYWYDQHPGGRALLDAYIGRDATEAMAGGVYKHTHGARCTAPELRIAHVLRKGAKAASI